MATTQRETTVGGSSVIFSYLLVQVLSHHSCGSTTLDRMSDVEGKAAGEAA
jgi:hypothetical protein